MKDTTRLRWPWPAVLFWALFAVHLIPFLAFRWFPTLDGPCHLYNARIILDLLRGDELTSHFFQLNPFPEPNWLGHAIMSVVMAVAPAFVAEKVVVLAYAAGLPLAFRFCVKRLHGQDPWLSLLIFPFIMSYPLRMGFFNFSLGLPLLLLAIGVWRRALEDLSRLRIWKLGLLLLALYFAHLAVMLVALAVLTGMTLFVPPAQGENSATPVWRRMKKPLFTLALAAAPVLFLTVAYFIRHSGEGPASSRFPATQIFEWVINGRPFISLSDDETPFARAIALALLGALLVLLLLEWSKPEARERQFWWVATGGAILLAFALPDAMASGKFLTPRLLLFAMLFAAMGIAAGRTPRWLGIPLVLIVSIADLLVFAKHYERTAALAKDAEELLAIAPVCAEDAVLLPLNYSDNWMHSNFSCYIGAATGTLVLDNYAAITPHMPVTWRAGAQPYEAVGTFHSSNRPCVDLDGYHAIAPNAPLLLSTWGLNASLADSCTMDVRRQLSFADSLSASPTGRAVLYQLR